MFLFVILFILCLNFLFCLILKFVRFKSAQNQIKTIDPEFQQLGQIVIIPAVTLIVKVVQTSSCFWISGHGGICWRLSWWPHSDTSEIISLLIDKRFDVLNIYFISSFALQNKSLSVEWSRGQQFGVNVYFLHSLKEKKSIKVEIKCVCSPDGSVFCLFCCMKWK